MLAENNWQLRTLSLWQLDLLRRSPQLSDNIAQSHITNLNMVLENLTKLLCMLVSQSFVVAIQPDPVLKTQHKVLNFYNFFNIQGLSVLNFYKTL